MCDHSITASFMNYLIRQKFFLEGKVGVGVVGTELGFPEVIAVRTAANGKERRRLDALGDGESGEEVPPFLKVFNEIFGGRENIETMMEQPMRSSRFPLA